MRAAQDLHKAQVSILSTLRHGTTIRYSGLMRPTGLESDVFKFHIRKLVRQGYVVKLSAGEYALTAKGKEFANNLDEVKRVPQRQPKHSLLLVVRKPDVSGDLYLFQRRLRQPHWGYWGFISGPVQWGVDAEATARRELKKQTGLTANFQTTSFYRQRDYDPKSGDLLEDKLFYIMQADNVSGELASTYPHGRSEWMTLAQLEQRDKHFESTSTVIGMLKRNQAYFSLDIERRLTDF